MPIKGRGRKVAEGRGSPEAVEKRRSARQLNTLLGGAENRPGLDGRTEKRRQRLLRELKEGRRGTPLKPIDFVTHVHELMELGETVVSLKKLGVKPRKSEISAELMEVVERAQAAYEFRPDAWRMLGIRLPKATPRRRRRKKKA